MRVHSFPWFYCEDLDPAGQWARLGGEEWHHGLHVLRLKEGDDLILFDGKGHGMEGTIRKSGKHEGEVELTRDIRDEFPSPGNLHINIAFAPTKNMERTEFAVEKIVELGVQSITFLDCRFGERTHLRMDRIRKVTIAAAKQSRKLTLPELQDSISPEEQITKSKIRNPMLRPASSHPDATAQQPSKILYCHLEEIARPLHHTYQGEEDVLVLIGPEGGFSAQEADNMKSMGALATSLGPYRLRVETAVIAACANIHQLYALKSTL